MDELNMKVNALIRYVTAATEQERRNALQVLQDLPMGTINTAKAAANLDATIQDLLVELGVPSNLLGYGYLACAIRIVTDMPAVIKEITKVLYPAVGKQCGTTDTRVKRGIRHAIEVCWDRIDFDLAAKLFGNTVNPIKGRPTNGEFISLCAQIVRRRMAGQ